MDMWITYMIRKTFSKGERRGERGGKEATAQL
jgi:hypothetical protein